MYLNNYELYSSRESLESRRSPPPPDSQLLNPLATLYPHVANMQPRNSTYNFDGYRDTGYFVAAYTTNSNQPSPSSPSPADSCQPPYRRFVSRLRRLLSRDDLKSPGRRLRSRPDTARPDTARPSTARPSTAWSNMARPTTARPTTSRGLHDLLF
ncbi:hypothetical protein N7495_009551 [Penicillium taxi]|uniref:uncharacterized protein n=1 Tax=Penicillium taxi TaxID=168475 RepID=UPI0025450357|nr:uncharacterized protein N7495_009551 [Penicillium taxi]KAJ5885041.1 hypothetical protein N7495_009551 [Penicillium taxi]